VLRVAIDKDGGVTMDDIADATREVSRVLDDTDLMGQQAYTLEVSSPGVDRPLTLPRHWRRNTGRLVKVSLGEGEPVTGRITASDDDAALLDVEGTEHRVPYAEVTKAKVQIEFKKHEETQEETES
jgi:ribosome maturation factor RimP